MVRLTAIADRSPSGNSLLSAPPLSSGENTHTHTQKQNNPQLTCLLQVTTMAMQLMGLVIYHRVDQDYLGSALSPKWKLGKWRLELCWLRFIPGDPYGSQIGQAGYSKVVHALHTFPPSELSISTFPYHFTLQGSEIIMPLHYIYMLAHKQEVSVLPSSQHTHVCTDTRMYNLRASHAHMKYIHTCTVHTQACPSAHIHTHTLKTHTCTPIRTHTH